MRRHRPDSEKARIASESFAPGASVNDVATRHGVAASTLGEWRRQAVRGELGPVPGVPAVPAVVPVIVGEDADPTTPAVSNAGNLPPRRRWLPSEKVRVVADSFASGDPVRLVAARHGVAGSTLHEWRALARKGRFGPVPGVAAPTAGTPAADMAVPSSPRINGPAPSPSVTVEAGEVVVRLPWDCPAERIVAVASGLRLAR